MRLHLVALVSTITMTRCVPSRDRFTEDVRTTFKVRRGLSGLHNYVKYQSARTVAWHENYTANNNWSRGR